jgi:hypothetical protein
MTKSASRTTWRVFIRKSAFQLRDGQALQYAEIFFPQPLIGDDTEPALFADQSRGVISAAEIAAVQLVDTLRSEAFGEGVGLLHAVCCQCAIEVALKAAGTVPMRFGVANDNEAGVHGAGSELAGRSVGWINPVPGVYPGEGRRPIQQLKLRPP